MKFRPCIDIHNGQVKQIVGGSLADAGNKAQENYVSLEDGAFLQICTRKAVKGRTYYFAESCG